MNSIMKFLAFLFPLFALISCAGYQLGGVQPKSLAHVRNISVPMFGNDTLHPRAEALATSAVVDAMVQDGTYKITTNERADAILEGRISAIRYTPIRGTRRDTLRPEELENTTVLSWKLLDAKNPTKVLASGTSSGESQFFVSSNLQTARNNALPDAFKRAAEALVSRIATGY